MLKPALTMELLQCPSLPHLLHSLTTLSAVRTAVDTREDGGPVSDLLQVSRPQSAEVYAHQYFESYVHRADVECFTKVLFPRLPAQLLPAVLTFSILDLYEGRIRSVPIATAMGH